MEHFTKKPGSMVGQGIEDPSMLLFGQLTGWIRLPKELGGTEHRVSESWTDANGRHHKLEGTDILVCDDGTQFLWYRLRS
jgi:hypothetical protein